MKQAKVFSIVVVTIIALYGLVGYCYLPLANFEGSLTRMGMLPESLFGWTRAQPAVDPNLMHSAGWQEADVLVIGDSFSNARIWQTAFTGRGLKVRTENWESIANICGDFGGWVRGMGFKGKYVVIESVEAYFEDRLARSAGCEKMRYHQSAAVHPMPPVTRPDRSIAERSGQLSVGIRTRLNVLKYEQLSDDPNFRSWDIASEVRMERLPGGCDLFSHPRCNDVLFYKKDRTQDLDETTLANMEKINARLSGFTTVWAVVPDKSTVYLHPEKQFWDKAEQRFHAPNVLKVFRNAINDKTIDLYKGNDTHTSTTGYLILGDLIYRSTYR